MKNDRLKSARLLLALISFLLTSLTSLAQQGPKADNSVHDRMYYLIQKSGQVVLPEALTQQLQTWNNDNPNKAKIIYAQSNVFKVLYNPGLSKEDRRFFGNQMLQSSSVLYAPLHNEIKKVLAKL
ncbi:MAG: hypothetical protein EOP49_32190 [Sphingobacteriales bacterium]|nr:MAG: hypothetical protein EOP49_32190 [Sphingobacteriales bacterium]